jgi:hypothetical protein
MRYGWTVLSIISVFSCLADWLPSSDGVGYVFVPGFRQSERHTAYYADSYAASTGEILICDSTLHTLPSHCFSFNFPEIRLIDLDGEYRPADLFSRLFSYVQQTALRVFDRIRGTKVLGQSRNGQSIKKHWIEIPKVSLGQQEDIECLSDAYDSYVKQYTPRSIILYGASRGAATILSFMGSTYLEKKNKYVSAVVLEGCYDSFDHTFSHYGRLKKFFYYKLAHSFLYDKDTKPLEPIDFVDTFPHDIPLLFISSKKDTIVAAECVCTLAQRLKALGHSDVYLLELHNASHIGYFCDDVIDTERYRSVVHAFYAAYDLPYIPSYACRGTALLKQCKL